MHRSHVPQEQQTDTDTSPSITTLIVLDDDKLPCNVIACSRSALPYLIQLLKIAAPVATK